MSKENITQDLWNFSVHDSYTLVDKDFDYVWLFTK